MMEKAIEKEREKKGDEGGRLWKKRAKGRERRGERKAMKYNSVV